eukprot:352159-Chlamydomonas_euryale.AAC.14
MHACAHACVGWALCQDTPSRFSPSSAAGGARRLAAGSAGRSGRAEGPARAQPAGAACWRAVSVKEGVMRRPAAGSAGQSNRPGELQCKSWPNRGHPLGPERP